MTADLDRSFERGLRESTPGPGIFDTPDGGPVTSAGLFAGFCGRKAANSPSQLMANLIIYRVPEVEEFSAALRRLEGGSPGTLSPQRAPCSPPPHPGTEISTRPVG
jgi:hypothetical protein